LISLTWFCMSFSISLTLLLSFFELPFTIYLILSRSYIPLPFIFLTPLSWCLFMCSLLVVGEF
jgi:hypothetical protein